MAFPSFMASKTIEILRGATAVLLFAAFGIGALLLAPLMFVFRVPERCLPIVRAAWCPLVGLFVGLGLIRIDPGNLPRTRGTILVVNHPSLIDVVLLEVLVPQTIYVAKRTLRRNFFLSAITRATALPNDATLCVRAEDYLAKGWNVLVFPEGTRSPAAGLHPFHRGAAQMALRSSAPILCIGLRLSQRILAKKQSAWEMGRSRITYSFRADAPTLEREKDGESLHAAAVRVTQELECRVKKLLG